MRVFPATPQFAFLFEVAQRCSGLFGSRIGLWLCTGQDIIMLVCLVVSFNSVLLVFADCGTKCAGKEVGSGAI